MMRTLYGIAWYGIILLGYTLFTVIVWPAILIVWFIVRGKCKPCATTKKGWMND